MLDLQADLEQFRYDPPLPEEEIDPAGQQPRTRLLEEKDQQEWPPQGWRSARKRKAASTPSQTEEIPE